MQLQSVQFDHRRDFLWVADEADCSEVLAVLQVAFLGRCYDQGLDPRGWHSPVCQVLLQIFMRAVMTASPPAWSSSVGRLSTPADFPFFSGYAAVSTFFAKDWVVLFFVCLGMVQY